MSGSGRIDNSLSVAGKVTYNKIELGNTDFKSHENTVYRDGWE